MEIKDVVGYENLYSVDECGNVYNRRGRKMSLLKGGKGSPYYHVDLCRNGEIKSRLVHRIVAMAFIDNPQNKPEVNHINGDKLDNRLCNLEWNTKRENQLHRFKELKHSHFGEKNTQSKLNSKAVIQIFELYGRGIFSLTQIAKSFSISPGTVCDIAKGRSWAHVTGAIPQRNIKRMEDLGYEI